MCLYCIYVSFNGITTAEHDKPLGPISIGSYLPSDYRDPDSAEEYGIKGYIDVTATEKELTNIKIEKGTPITVKLSLTYVAHVDNAEAVIVTLDPIKNDEITIEQVLPDGEGIINVNKLIEYKPNEITLKPGETKEIELTITFPENFPNITLPLPTIGMKSSIPILKDNMRVNLDV